MNTDPFEEHLRKQSLRGVPAAWRNQILSAAEAAQATGAEAHDSPLSFFLSTLNRQLSTLLWPSPAAWAGVAAVWFVIFSLNLAARDNSNASTKSAAVSSPQVVLAIREQSRVLSELIGPVEPAVQKPVNPPVSRPHSESSPGISAA
jgi:hypothetical protein